MCLKHHWTIASDEKDSALASQIVKYSTEHKYCTQKHKLKQAVGFRLNSHYETSLSSSSSLITIHLEENSNEAMWRELTDVLGRLLDGVGL